MPNPNFKRSRILQGDCLKKLKTLPSNSVDSMVTDPPAGISFMGKDWDHHKGGRTEWIAWMQSVMEECLRVLKPGAHALVWSIPRTSHWTGTALEEAGWEVRDTILHCFGSGFPKSLNVGKAIDKAAGVERKVVGTYKNKLPTSNGKFATDAWSIEAGKWRDVDITAPATPDAKKWEGFGTALKPAVEIWWLVRKPLSEKTVAKNVLKHGVGALNIDASRIGTQDNLNGGAYSKTDRKNPFFKSLDPGAGAYVQPTGRFPANLLFSHHPACEEGNCVPECAVLELDRQSGTLHGRGNKNPSQHVASGGFLNGKTIRNDGYSRDSGGASRFFATFRYVAKPSRSERNAGCEGLAKRTKRILNGGIPSAVNSDPRGMSGGGDRQATNHHPTVKPLKLMRYLITMITPPGGVCLDPFLGSGTTAVAAKQAGFRFIGIEREREYVAICRARIKAARPLQEIRA